MRRSGWIVGATLVGLLLAGTGWPSPRSEPTATPQPLVDAYDSLAQTILDAKKTEWNLVHAILATTWGHAEAEFARAKAKLGRGEDAGAEIEVLAALVAQLGNEGDAAVAGIRKRLVEGGHHHHSSGEKTGDYDEGFVIVTRQARKTFLDAAGRIARLGGKPDVAALEAEWSAVRQQFGALHEGIAGQRP